MFLSSSITFLIDKLDGLIAEIVAYSFERCGVVYSHSR
jgi:hypothetical protein